MTTFETLPSAVDAIDAKLDNLLSIIATFSPKPQNRRLTIEEVAELSGYSKHTIYGKIHRNEIPFKKVGGSRKLFFDSDEIHRWIENGK